MLARCASSASKALGADAHAARAEAAAVETAPGELANARLPSVGSSSSPTSTRRA